MLNKPTPNNLTEVDFMLECCQTIILRDVYVLQERLEKN
jgi:hypothetical protein